MKTNMLLKQTKTIVLTLTALMALGLAANAQTGNEFGPDAGNNGVTGSYNTAYGDQALNYDTTGDDNVAIGQGALYANMTGSENTANGDLALSANTNGVENTANGSAALVYNTSGSDNTANGIATLFENTTGNNNTADGDRALYYNIAGNNNTANGTQALYNSTGSFNTAFGAYAGDNLTNGDYNIYIGNEGIPSETGVIRIGTAGIHNNTFIAGISGNTVANANPVVIDANGQLGTVDASTLAGPAGPTGATGATGAKGATGAQGPVGPAGAPGVGLVKGAYMFLPIGSPAPAGFTKIGSMQNEPYKSVAGKAMELVSDIYQKN